MKQVPPNTDDSIALKDIIAVIPDDPDVGKPADFAPTTGRVLQDSETDAVYVGTGSSWLDIGAESGLASGIVDLDPRDVRSISAPAEGDTAYHDGSGANTAGPAHYTGSNWISTVDGTTIS
jgi:hypothetical protein